METIQYWIVCFFKITSDGLVFLSLFFCLFLFFCFCCFFCIRVFFTDTDGSQDWLPPAHEHWDIYFQFCMWGDHHVFLIATLVFTRLLLDEIYHLIELPFDWLIDWLMMQCLYVYLMNWFKVLVTAILTWETSGFELASTITLALQANRLTKCAIHSWLFTNPIKGGLARFDHAQSNSKKWPKG